MDDSISDDTLDLLVGYALGILEPAEIEQTNRLLAERPELRTTLASLRSTVERLPLGLPETTPPAHLRQRVLDRAVGRTSAAPIPARRRNWQWLFNMLGGVAAVAALLLGLQANQLRNENSALQLALVQARTQQQQIAQVLTQPNTVAALSGASGSATLFVSSDTSLLAAQLPPIASDLVYQLWVIEGQNAPLSAGVFQVDPSGIGVLRLDGPTPASGATLAITVEPAPGSPGPTSEIVIVGTISG